VYNDRSAAYARNIGDKPHLPIIPSTFCTVNVERQCIYTTFSMIYTESWDDAYCDILCTLNLPQLQEEAIENVSSL